ncbi:hypothetical protein SKAU_G00236230 [Synaphobranchus kaupii]|uniref:Uncharacterized protein n=1 Tax=Synaphobranchus kaupii TaxID=118154 RepID=A0A9Q1F6I9_SYNKA|nr:hypothetical protein SKAU_G00236230 [Synaphobranchus kaupii]
MADLGSFVASVCYFIFVPSFISMSLNNHIFSFLKVQFEKADRCFIFEVPFAKRSGHWASVPLSTIHLCPPRGADTGHQCPSPLFTSAHREERTLVAGYTTWTSRFVQLEEETCPDSPAWVLLLCD